MLPRAGLAGTEVEPAARRWRCRCIEHAKHFLFAGGLRVGRAKHRRLRSSGCKLRKAPADQPLRAEARSLDTAADEGEVLAIL